MDISKSLEYLKKLDSNIKNIKNDITSIENILIQI